MLNLNITVKTKILDKNVSVDVAGEFESGENGFVNYQPTAIINLRDEKGEILERNEIIDKMILEGLYECEGNALNAAASLAVTQNRY